MEHFFSRAGQEDCPPSCGGRTKNGARMVVMPKMSPTGCPCQLRRGKSDDSPLRLDLAHKVVGTARSVLPRHLPGRDELSDDPVRGRRLVCHQPERDSEAARMITAIICLAAGYWLGSERRRSRAQWEHCMAALDRLIKESCE